MAYTTGDHRDRIQELMLRSITSDVLNDDESAELKNWLEQDALNQREYDDLKAVKELLNSGISRKPDTDAAWLKVKGRIGDLHPIVVSPAPVKALKWIRYAAAVVLISAIGLFVYKGLYRQQNEFSAQNVGRQKNSHVELVLSNGERLSLQGNREIAVQGNKDVPIASSKGNALIYHTNTAERGFHKLIVPNGNQYELVLPDGTRVWVNSGSELSYRVDFNQGVQREVKLSGEAYFEVAKNKARPFVVNADKQRVEVLGTHFNVNSYPDEQVIRTTLLEGSVKVSNLVSDRSSVLIPGKQSLVKGVDIEVVDADLEEALAWKNGLFIFNDEPLESIMKKVSRWYDVDVVYQDVDKKKKYGGSVPRFDDISKMLKQWELTGGVHFEIEGRRVILMK